ncbi:MAG: EF2563 family selenium-dependent molybdenum hydroxylase system protein [Chloroflexi bacterium]|nr:EF2563 family selenium-dependent molybdenum hydroxylase system protein [Chloroflexota bacterium]
MASVFFRRALVLVRGGGDLASGAIYRLHRAGFPVIVTELAQPLLVRRAVCYGSAIYEGVMEIDGVSAQRAETDHAVGAMLASGVVPVLADPDGQAIRRLSPAVVLDGRMAKKNLGTRLDDAPLVVALGPGFTAGTDCHAVIETNRGHDLGRVIWQGAAEADTGEPGITAGQSHSRVLRAPSAGYVQAYRQIGEIIEAGQVIASVNGQSVVAAFTGVLRGLIHEQVRVEAGAKIGDLDPRIRRENCFTISDKSLAVGGGVLEAVLAAPQVRPYLTGYEAPTRI